MENGNIEKIIYLIDSLEQYVQNLSIYEISEFKKSKNILNMNSPNLNFLKKNLDSGFRRLYEMGIYNNDVSLISSKIYQVLEK